MPIMFNSILTQAGLDLTDVMLLRHQDQRAKKGCTPYELWRDDRPAFELYQSHQNFDKKPKLMRARYWAAFVGTAAGETMFVGVYQAAYRGTLQQDTAWPHADGIDKAGSCDTYDLQIDPRFEDLAGKLLIEWRQGKLAWIQRADRQDKVVIELRPEFKEPEFPGFLNFMKPLSQIEALPHGWITTLKANRGIYLLTCPVTKEQYVGKADGEQGFWRRWLEYCQTGHGGNIGLKSRNPSDYQVSILEVAGTAATEAELSQMEDRWKRKLQSREMGLNRN
jgi:hypothetical protein